MNKKYLMNSTRNKIRTQQYPAVEEFLKTQKNCLAEYVGTELSLKRGKTSLRVDVFGIANHAG